MADTRFPLCTCILQIYFILFYFTEKINVVYNVQFNEYMREESKNNQKSNYSKSAYW